MKNFKLSITFLIFSLIKPEQDSSFYWIIADQEPLKIPKSIIGASHKNYCFLNSSPYYHRYQSKQACLDQFSAEVVESVLGVKPNFFNTYYFNRSSSRLVIVVPPYGAQLNDLIRFAGIFSDTDVLIIDYYKNLAKNPFLAFYSFVNVPTEFQRKMRVAQLVRVLQEAKKQGYQEIIGASQCYGSWVLLDAHVSLKQSGQAGFDKLIVDSCPAGTSALRQKFIEDPVAISTLGNKTGPLLIKALTFFFSYSITIFIDCLYQDFSVKNLLNKVDVPILFIHNQKDFVVTVEEFKEMYHAVNHTNKAVLLTDFKHLQASLKSKELYAQIVSQFIQGVLF